jgi:hypothetical protein
VGVGSQPADQSSTVTSSRLKPNRRNDSASFFCSFRVSPDRIAASAVVRVVSPHDQSAVEQPREPTDARQGLEGSEVEIGALRHVTRLLDE